MNTKLLRVYTAYSVLINDDIWGDAVVNYKENQGLTKVNTRFIPYLLDIEGRMGVQLLSENNWKENKMSTIEVGTDEEALDNLVKTDLKQLFDSFYKNATPYANQLKFLKTIDRFTFELNKNGLPTNYYLIHELLPFHDEPYFQPGKILLSKDHDLYKRFSADQSDQEIILEIFREIG